MKATRCRTPPVADTVRQKELQRPTIGEQRKSAKTELLAAKGIVRRIDDLGRDVRVDASAPLQIRSNNDIIR